MINEWHKKYDTFKEPKRFFVAMGVISPLWFTGIVHHFNPIIGMIYILVTVSWTSFLLITRIQYLKRKYK